MAEIPDLSWMWHCSNKVMDYNFLIKDKAMATTLNKTAAIGFRIALRKMEELELITMGDIDRSMTKEDEEKWEQLELLNK